MDKILFVALGGSLGATLRYILSIYLTNNLPHSTYITFITPVVIINSIGCFIAGIMFSLVNEESIKLLLIAGMLGGFTTFSSFGLEFLHIAKDKNLILAIIYAVCTNVLSLVSLYIGWQLTKIVNT